MDIIEAIQKLKDYNYWQNGGIDIGQPETTEAINVVAKHFEQITDYSGVHIIAKERKRQIEELKFDYSNDSLYANNQLAQAAAWYSFDDETRNQFLKSNEEIEEEFGFRIGEIWPWKQSYFKPTPDDRIKELAKAGALIAAQIDYELNKK